LTVKIIGVWSNIVGKALKLTRGTIKVR
jgi:hypothetical protein